jgi:glucose-1-phosphate cytidylyltransferase
MEVHKQGAEPWKVTLIDTGDTSMTGGRLKRVAGYLADDEDFCFTYGDGVSDVNISNLIKFHQEHGKEATLTATYAPGRFGALDIKNDQIMNFSEKPKGDGAMINGGFFVLSPKVINRIAKDTTTWEREPLMGLAEDGELMAYKHKGFWQPMDTLRDKQYLQELWDSGSAPWKNWD